ncbi:MAG: hypothetical protein GTO51_07415 [Candidatus Latescibacteria bacterium]|nr:hypothetical protein [Candidatus Latescibacterota bacterium]
MAILKPVTFVFLAIGAFVLFAHARNKAWEINLYRRAVIIGTLLKLVLCVCVYVIRPSLNQHSDAANFYLPQTQALLSGEVPYSDFASSYSPLFTILLAVPVKIWPSVGSIVLTMLLLETAMLYLYIRRAQAINWDPGWRAAFLYASSPFSCYWVAFSGHNGVIIAFFVMASLLVAERGRSWISGVIGACGYLFSKLLAILSWPGLVFYERPGWWRPTVPLALSLAAVASLVLFHIDVTASIRTQSLMDTTGNLWYLLVRLIPGVDISDVWVGLPALSFAVVFVPMLIAFVKHRDAAAKFDTAAAFIAATNLLFFVVSKKVFSFYMVMTLVFVIHAIVADGRHLVRRLVPLAFLGSVAFIEESHHWRSPVSLVIEVLRVSAYVYWFVVCLKLSMRPADESKGQGGTHRSVQILADGVETDEALRASNTPNRP